MKWTAKLPEKPGFYWVRNISLASFSPEIVEIRDFVGKLCIGNYPISTRSFDTLWAGPLEPPK